eukprot:2907526-Amphidinium_carterae.1
MDPHPCTGSLSWTEARPNHRAITCQPLYCREQENVSKSEPTAGKGVHKSLGPTEESLDEYRVSDASKDMLNAQADKSKLTATDAMLTLPPLFYPCSLSTTDQHAEDDARWPLNVIMEPSLVETASNKTLRGCL